MMKLIKILLILIVSVGFSQEEEYLPSTKYTWGNDCSKDGVQIMLKMSPTQYKKDNKGVCFTLVIESDNDFLKNPIQGLSVSLYEDKNGIIKEVNLNSNKGFASYHGVSKRESMKLQFKAFDILTAKIGETYLTSEQLLYEDYLSLRGQKLIVELSLNRVNGEKRKVSVLNLDKYKINEISHKVLSLSEGRYFVSLSSFCWIIDKPKKCNIHFTKIPIVLR